MLIIITVYKDINKKNSILPSNKIRKIINKKGKTYLATEKGVVVIALTDTIIINKNTRKITDDNIISLQVDKDEKIWAGTNTGLIKISKEGIKIFTTENSELIDNHIWSLKIEKDNLWIGTKKGLFLMHTLWSM